jgi:hypothetical protein
MDDFNVSSLHESRNEWSSRLISILTPMIVDGYKSILEEALKLCKENGEMNKYLMTLQNLISRVPKWNSAIIETERRRICEKSGCNYLDDLVTCVHIIQLKILTAMRVGQKQKKIDINIPKLDDFIHKCYINAARKIYKNVYLFETVIPPLQVQKNHRELEIIIQEAILITLRDSIPIDAILKAYMDETVEEDVVEEIKEHIIEEPIQKNDMKLNIPQELQQYQDNINNSDYTNKNNRLSFNDIDYISGDDGNVTSIIAPKNIERLEKISEMRANERKSELDDDDDNNAKLTISDQPVNLDFLDVHNIEEPKIDLLPDLLIDDIEILE